MDGCRTLVAALRCFLLGLLAGACAGPPTESHGEEKRRPLFRVHLGLPGLEGVNLSGGPEQLSVLEQNGQGVALLDYDGDGLLDIFVTNGGTFEGWRQGRLPGPGLYRNLGGLRFADVTEEAGLSAPLWGTGAMAADLTGNGFFDLYVAAWGPNRLFRNEGDGTFTDITTWAGVGDPRWSSSAVAADFDGDGRLDLYVSNYVVFDPDTMPDREEDGAPCLYRGIETGCGPWRYPGERDTLYLQQPDGRFRDASLEWGLEATAGFRGMGIASGDLDGDGHVDVFVGCDVMPNLYLRNLGDRFVEVGMPRGGAVNALGQHESGMGVAAADLFGHGRLDLLVTNFADETNTYYANDGGYLVDRTDAVGMAAHRMDLGWGIVAADFDLDGWRDVLIANGHIYPQVERLEDPADRYQQPPRLFLGTGRERLAAVPSAQAFAWAGGDPSPVRLNLRAIAVGDLTNSGRLDVVAVQHNGPLVVFENLSPRHGRTVALQSRDGSASPHGTHLTVGSWHHSHWPTQGYQSSHDPRVLVPPGAGSTARTRWPDGDCEVFALPEPGERAVLLAGTGEPTPC